MTSDETGMVAIFQSTLPREERPSLYLLGAHLHNFNPRSHERSDSQQSELITMLRISIHAPTRGATAWKVTRRQSKKFQSTLPREERREAVAMLASNIVFQSTLPREERPKSGDDGTNYGNFNPRSHERSDRLKAKPNAELLDFNPRSHERSDPAACSLMA